jgi:hypothetical protein
MVISCKAAKGQRSIRFLTLEEKVLLMSIKCLMLLCPFAALRETTTNIGN